MTSFEVQKLTLQALEIRSWGLQSNKHRNWPIVYTLGGAHEVYIGESLSATTRLRQHLDSPAKQHLGAVRVILGDRFNKSVCLDLESYLIRLFAGDGKYQVLNGNEGITDADYYDRESYRSTFSLIFDELRAEGWFDRTIPEIVNSDLFKLSPFKALTVEQAGAVEDILEGLFDDIAAKSANTVVIQGEPGTGKTIVAIYLIKLLRDIQASGPDDELPSDSIFSDFFVEDCREALKEFRIGFVIPQQSLRQSVGNVFHVTPGLHRGMVLSPWDVATDPGHFDLLIVDEAHRLNQRANQSSGIRNRQFREVNINLFGADDPRHTQLDWLIQKSTQRILLLDAAQSVRPADLSSDVLRTLTSDAKARERYYRLANQMRVKAGDDYVGYVRRVLAGHQTERTTFEGYNLHLFDDLQAMRSEIAQRDRDEGLARLVAGFAWPWLSKKDRTAYDILIDGVRLRWNGTDVDWINSPTSADEVGSIHTVQGYDLNYAGVIIGPDLRYEDGAVTFHRSSYYDKKGRENNPTLGIVYTDDDILKFVQNIYAVLLTRGIRGTYVYVVDPPLREYLRQFF